ncbi:MAG: hypothetical protein ACT4OP_04870 [Actinomycetota bacterium]
MTGLVWLAALLVSYKVIWDLDTFTESSPRSRDLASLLIIVVISSVVMTTAVL